MYDLQLIRNGSSFDVSNEASTHIAMIHQSFRMVSKRRGNRRKQFSAHFPALGLLNLAHSLRVEASKGKIVLPEIKYFDEEVYDNDEDFFTAIIQWFGNSKRCFIAASSYTATIDYLETFLARFDPTRFLIIVGGAHVTLAPEINYAHIVVRGEGSAALKHILTKLFTVEFGKSVNNLGLCYRLDGHEVTQKQAFDSSLVDLPSPAFAYDILPKPIDGAPIYATSITRMLGNNPQIYICTQSCRARCTFCSTYLIHGRGTARPFQLISEDLHHLVNDLQHDSIEFHDDDLLQHPDLLSIMGVLKELNVPWFCYGRVDTIDEEIAVAMADAGCKRIFLGIESMQQAKLDNFNKCTTVEGNKKAITALADAGVGPIAGFIIGSPDDTIESILQDLDEFLKLPLFAITCNILSPDPGTVEFHRARKRGGDLMLALGGETGKRLMPNVKRYGPLAPVGLPTVCSGVNKTTLNQLLTLVDTSFYFRPHIWKGLTVYRTTEQIQLVRSYYHLRLSSLENLLLEQTEPIIAQRLISIRQSLQTRFWQEDVFGCELKHLLEY